MRNKEQQKKYFRSWYLKNKERNAERGRRWLQTPKGKLWSANYRKSTKKPFDLRFWSYVDKLSDENCWQWLKAKYPSGYGRFGKLYAHRVSYELMNGKIPSGFCICHKCDNPSCVNPNHLWAGTVADNMHDRDRKGRDRFSKLKI